MPQPVISAVIPSYNGKDLLATCLPLLAGELAAYDSEIIVVDDRSIDDTTAWLAAEWPQVTVVAGPHRGFAAACRPGLAAARGRYTLLLNNDMHVMAGTVGRLVERLEREDDLFAVGGAYRTPQPDGTYRCSYCGAVHQGETTHHRPERPALDAPAAGGLFRTDRLRELGWFDTLFRPFYWEDLDLGWNAWRAGYRIIFDAGAVMLHQHGATITRHYRPTFYQAANWRNLYLFAWKNCEQPILGRHLWRIGWRGVRAARGGYGLSWAWGLAMALPQAPRAWLARRRRPVAVRSDEQILKAALPDPQDLLRQLY